jgi:benzoyl-CoA reductase/2-hydroxyglutaryl-CoA dehydratase subunit BcrC/BadD/HgdB
MLRLKEVMEEQLGVVITEEDIRQAIHLENRKERRPWSSMKSAG